MTQKVRPVRYQGRLTDWRDDRGFGFITPNGGGTRVFVHISSFTDRSRRPSQGALLTYEVALDEKGRPQARATAFVGGVSAEPKRPRPARPAYAALAVVVSVLAYATYTHFNPAARTADIVRPAVDRDPGFSCEPAKRSCSQMTSCAEAMFHQHRCGVTGMDGDGDGIPCEQQWC